MNIKATCLEGNVIESLWRNLEKSKFVRAGLIAICLAAMLATGAVLVKNSMYDADSIFDIEIFYTTGSMWNAGEDPYDEQLFAQRYYELTGKEAIPSVFYPPQGLVLFSVFPYMPFDTARLALLFTNWVLLIVSLGLMILILSRHTRIRIYEVTFLILLLGTSFGRTTLRCSQLSIVVAVLLFGTYLFQQSRKDALAGGMLSLLTFKPTFVPLLALYYLLRKKIKLLAVLIVGGAVLTILPVLATGRPLIPTLINWLKMLSIVSAEGGNNSPDPSILWSGFLIHLEPLLYRILGAQSTFGFFVYVGIIIALIVGASILIYKTEPSQKNDLLDFALVSAISAIAVYHRNYDIFLLFPGLIAIYVHMIRSSGFKQQFLWGVVLTGILLVLLAPNDILIRATYTNPALSESYFWRVVSPLLGWTSLAVTGILFWLKAHSLKVSRSTGTQTEFEALKRLRQVEVNPGH
jgi:hypothetical protein